MNHAIEQCERRRNRSVSEIILWTALVTFKLVAEEESEDMISKDTEDTSARNGMQCPLFFSPKACFNENEAAAHLSQMFKANCQHTDLWLRWLIFSS